LLHHSLYPTLAKNTDSPLSGLVSETADTLLNYSDVHHQLHHEASPMSDDDAIQQLMAKDALHVMQFIHKTHPELRRELMRKKFTKLTFNQSEDDPRKHPIVTYLRARLVSGNLDEGSKLCRTLESCTGLDKETERCCWYLLFEKMQEEGVLLEHHWGKNRGGILLAPVMDCNGDVSMRQVANVTLANIMIGPFGRSVALEYLKGIVDEAKEELFPGYRALASSKTIRSKHRADHEKQYFTALKDAARRTALKFLLPRPHTAVEALSLATRVSEANKPPLLKYHSGLTGQTAKDLCLLILQEPSLLKLWEESEEALEEEEEATAAAAVQEVEPQPAIMPQEEPVEEGDVMDMSMELIPLTPAKTPQKPIPAPKPAPPDEEIIELGDSDDEEVADEDALEEEQSGEIELESSAEEDDSATKSLEDSSHVDELEREDEAASYDSNEEYPKENEINYPPHYHQYPGNYR
jgi:hypothetical protein